jgi:hypothetical protein
LVSITVLGLGLAAGIGLSAALSGSSADDPCFGAGRLDRKIIGPADEGSKEFSVCKRLGLEVIFDPDGTAVIQNLRDEEIVEYYKTRPAENPIVIANATADAEIVKSFVDITPPAKLAEGDCPKEAARTSFPEAGLSLCMPVSWIVKLDTEGSLTVGDAGSTLAIYPKGTSGTYGTRCERPATVPISGGDLRICAGPLGPENDQGHGLVLPSGREGGLAIYNIANVASRNLTFAVAYSIVEE